MPLAGLLLVLTPVPQTFDAPETFATAPLTNFVLHDFDLDGDLDVVGSLVPPVVIPYLGDGVDYIENVGGVLDIAGRKRIGQCTNSLRLLDVDGDGWMDVLLQETFGTPTTTGCDFQNELVWIRNLGGDDFAPAVRVVDAHPDVHILQDVGDIDGDGDEDVLVRLRPDNSSPYRVEWVESIDQGGFAAPVTIASVPADGVGVQLVDVNGDGLLDVTWWEDEYSQYAGHKLRWTKGAGDGTFGQVETIHHAWLEFFGAFEMLDVDGDGDLDLIGVLYDDDFGFPDPQHLAWLENQTGAGPGSFPVWSTTPIVVSPDIGYDMSREGGLSLGDFDRDGDEDVLLYRPVNHFDRRIEIYENFGGGTFGGPVELNDPHASHRWAPVLVDVDGDQDLDLLYAEADPVQQVVVCRNVDPVGESYCAASPNSTGSPGSIEALGSPYLSDGAFALRASALPVGVFGMFVAGRLRDQVPITGSGQLCVGGGLGRFDGPGQIRMTSGAGTFELAVRAGALPTPSGLAAANPGETWTFQAWHREVAGWTPASNLTDAVEVIFLP